MNVKVPVSRFVIFERDGFRCVYCGKSSLDGSELHADHVVPKSKGGPDHAGNMVTSCVRCNLGKGARRLRSGSERRILRIVKRRNKRQGIPGAQLIKTPSRERKDAAPSEAEHHADDGLAEYQAAQQVVTEYEKRLHPVVKEATEPPKAKPPIAQSLGNDDDPYSHVRVERKPPLLAHTHDRRKWTMTDESKGKARTRNGKWMGFTSDTDPAEARAAFEAKHGYPPAEVVESGPILLVGPLQADVATTQAEA